MSLPPPNVASYNTTGFVASFLPHHIPRAMSPPITVARTSAPRAFHDLHGYHQTAVTLARRAGNLIRQHRFPAVIDANNSLELNSKQGSADLVTNADHASQHLIFSALREIYPDHCFIGEEDDSHAPLTDAPTWIVDAIDGTTNYVHGLSECCVSVALVVDRRPLVGAIYNPFRGEMYHAARGRGAFLNDEPIAVKPCHSFHDALILTEWGYVRDSRKVRKILGANERLVMANVRGIRQLGAGALDLCYVAVGRADAVYCGVAGEGWKMWDYAAGVLVAEEAGAKVTALDGKEFDLTSPSMACATEDILSKLLQIVNRNE